jgi:hypothetical protein
VLLIGVLDQEFIAEISLVRVLLYRVGAFSYFNFQGTAFIAVVEKVAGKFQGYENVIIIVLPLDGEIRRPALFLFR